MSDILQVQGINSKGFGMIPKLVMQDRRLTSQAKAIYSYFASYAGGGRTAFPSRAKILEDLGIGKDTYYAHFNLLERYRYIKVVQERSKGGVFKRNLYTLAESLPCPEIADTVNPIEPCPGFPCPAGPCPVEPYPAGEDTNNNNTKNNTLKSNSLSGPSAPIDTGGTDRRDRTDIDDQTITTYEILIKANIGYESFQEGRPSDIGLVDEIIAVMVDVLVTPGTYVALDGENKPRKLVSRRLMELGHWHIEHVLGQFKAVTAPIKKKRQYLLTMLYNAALEFDAHYTNELCSALNGGGQ